MRNPLSILSLRTSAERVLAKWRRARSVSAGGRSRIWAVGVLFCISLAGCISLMELARRNSSKATTVIVTEGTSERNLAQASGEKPRPSEKKKASSVATIPEPQPTEKRAPSTQPAEPNANKAPTQQVLLGPPVANGEPQGEKEDSEISRKRQSWFFDQRAYPNQHIPNGAFQKALEQRELMRQQQRAEFQAKAAAGAASDAANLISFPGDALWHLMGPQPLNNPFGQNGGSPTASGRITAIALDPTDATGATAYIGGAAGGVWKTTDGGTTWTSLTDSQPSLAVGSITIDPNNHLTIYVGTGEENFNGDAFYGAGILKSTDGGNTWTQLGRTTFAQALGPNTGGAYIGQIAVQPGNSQIVLAAVSFFVNGTIGGIYRSTDGGNTWTEDAAPRGLSATSVFFESTSNAGTTATAWMAMGNPFGEAVNGVYKSTDSGATWTLQAGGLPASNLGRIILGYAPSTSGAGATVYAAIATSATNSSDLLGLFATTNGGTSWSTLNQPSGVGFCNHQCFYDMVVGVSPENPAWLVIGGGAFNNNSSSVFRSLDGGTTWIDITLGSTAVRPHVDTHALVWTGNGASLYDGNDGGIWRTDNPKSTPLLWADLNTQLAITQFYPAPSAAVADDNYGFGGTQDNDVDLFQNSLAWQNEFICGDGGFTTIDQITPTTIWATCDAFAGSKVKKAVFNGQFLTLSNNQTIPGFDVAETAITNSGDAMQFIPPLAVDASNTNNLYFGTCRVWWAYNAASTLADSFVPLTPTWVSASGDLTNNNSPTAQCNGANGGLTSLEVARKSSQIVVAGTSNGKVWESNGAGITPTPPIPLTLPTWVEIDKPTLPNRSVTAVRTKSNDSTGAIVYVTYSGFGACAGCGTPGHVFKTTNANSGAPTWTNISGDLPDIPVNDIIVDHSGNVNHDALYIATDVGVFGCPDPESATPCKNWTVIGDGLPNSPVLGLAMRPFSRILRAATHGRSMWQIQLSDVNPPNLAFLSSMTPAAANAGAASAAVTLNGVNFSPSTQVQFQGTTTGVTTTFVNTTQLNVTFGSALLTTGGVYSITLLDSQGVDPGSTLGTGGLPFTVMNPLLDPTSMTPASGVAYTAVHFHLTSGSASEPFLPNSVLAFYDTSTPPVLKFQLPNLGETPTISGGGTVYDLTTAIPDLTTPGTYRVFPYNPAPGGAIDPLALAAAAGGPVPFSFTLTANPGPVLQVSSPLSLFVNALGANSGTTFSSFQVSNLAGATLNITAASIGGTNAANFVFIAPAAQSCNFETTGTVSVPAGSFCFFGLKYTAGTPPGNATSNATLNLTDNAAGSPQSFPITGNIVSTSGVLLLSPVNFGAVAVGTTSPTMNATLTNETASSVNVTSAFSISGANAADFHIVAFVPNGDTLSACPAAPFALAAFAACDESLNFTPSLPASAESANLNVTASVTVVTPSPNLTGIGVEISSISPQIVATGGPAFTLTVNGGGFASSAVVNVNGSPRLTTFVSASQLLASIPASDIATAGSLAITVTTPVPGGTTSEPKTLIVAQAKPATNDNVNFATNASVTPFRITQDTTQATAQTNALTSPIATPIDPTPCAIGNTARSVWFTFTAPASGKVVADTRFSSYTTNLSAWTLTGALPSTTATFAAVACNSGSVPAQGVAPAASLITFPVTSGTTYYLMVTDPAGNGGTLTFSLDFASTAPANDAFASATNIAATPFSTTENTILATANTGAADPVPSCASGTGLASSGDANSVWFKFTAPSAGTITADTLTSPYDTILTAVTGAPGTFSQIACNDNATSGTAIAQSQVSFAATSGTTYFFMVSAFLGDGGTTNFHLTFTASASNPVPTVTSISPTSATAGGAGFTLTVNGANFIASSVVNFNGSAKTTTFVNATQVTAAITAADIATAGTFPVTVTNPAPGGGTSAPSPFTVNNPVPTLTSLSPTSATAGSAAFTLTVNGTNFLSSSVVSFNGNAKTTTFVNATQLTAAITAADIATAGTFPVTVTNPSPGGGISASLNLTVNNPAPTITSLSPNGATVGGTAFTLTVNGTGFVSTSQVKFGANNRTTTFVNSTQITAAILASDIAAVGPVNVTVTNPAPGGGTSAPSVFTVSTAPNPVPTLTSIAPTNGILNNAVTLTLTGTNFIAGSLVNFGTNQDGGGAVTNGGNTLTITIPAGQVTPAGNLNVSVTNPAPGGGTSATQVFQIFNPVPTITSLSPASTIVGGPQFTLTVNGTNFISGAVVAFNGTNVTTSFVSATQLTATIPAASIAAPGTLPVTVTNPAPTTGASLPFNFTINNPVPTVTTISPTSTTAGGPQFTLTVNGTNFVNNSSVLFNGSAQVTNFVSSTQLTATILASEILAGGTANVSVNNPAPGGGTSGNATFTINNPTPTLTSINPTSATAGSAAFTLNLTGTSFVNGAVVKFNGNAKTTTFISATALTAAITAADIAAAGTFAVVVTNPTPGGGTSGSVSFTVNNPAPTIASLSPASATVGGAAFTLTVNGSNFVSGSTVNYNGSARTTTFVNSTQVTAAITAADIAAAGTFNVTVTNPAPGGGTSTAATFTVNNALPTITSLSPNSVTAGGAAFSLTVTGTNFVSTSVVNFNGAARTTTFVSATQLTAAITAADIATASTANITATNPAPGGGTSAASSLTINNPVPTITSLNPSGVTAGGAAFALTVNGTNFVSGSVVKFNGNAKTTTFVSATQLTAAILAADIATAGNANVTVTNAAPGGGTTTNFIFNVASAPNPVPTLTSISPTSGTAGGAAFTLTLNGTNFVASSMVNFNGAVKTTTVVSATQLTAAITAADIGTAGSFPVTVTNPAPGGGTTAAINFAVNNPMPSITSLSPASAIVGGAAFALTINGTGFVNGATVSYSGSNRTTTFVSSTQLTAAINAADIAAVGSFPVVVTNPAPGGGASTAANFSVNNPPPTITTLSPASATAGGAAFTLTINGTAFVSGATVTFNGSAKTTAFVNATQLTAPITAADIATGGSVNVIVTNPAPGGGASAPAQFTINNPAPTINTISPTTATAGGSAFTLTVNGTNFVSTSIVNFGGKAETTTFVNSTQLTAAIAAADIATAGPVNVTVTNPAPGGGTSAASVFTVNNPVPTVTTLSPPSVTAGAASFTLTVNGTNFVSTSVVNFNGTASTTTFVSATQLTAAITAAQVVTPGAVNVTVTNPAPGGGTSANATFTINNPVPTVTTLSPTSATAGGAAFTLTVNGTNFAASSVVNFNGAAQVTTFKSATQLTAGIPATAIATAGAVNVSVTTPAPGGGTSGNATFTINNAQPTLASLSPASTLAGGAAFTLTINGNGFVNGATVTFNETNPAKSFSPVATFVSSTQITAAITAAEITSVDTYNVTVTNPPPSVGPSLALTFTVNNPVPTITAATAGGQNHAAAGTAFTLTVTGTNFVATSVINFGTKAEPTTLVNPTQITAAVPASDVAAAGSINVTVVNPAPGGGPTPTAIAFTLDGYAVAGPAAAVTVTAGQTASIPVTITPTANGFANQVTFAVSGLPPNSTFAALSATPGNAKSTVNLMISTTARGSAPPSAPLGTPMPPVVRLLLVSWLSALLLGIYLARIIRRTPRFRRYAVLVPLALLLVSGGVIAGCASGMKGTPAGTSQLAITATSGSFTQNTSATLTVQ